MQNNNDNYQFHPRGITKWHAFASVISAEEQKDMVIEEDILDIELLDDKKNYLDYLLQDAFSHNKEITVIFIENNQLIRLEGLITALETHRQEITIDGKKLPIIKIIDIIY